MSKPLLGNPEDDGRIWFGYGNKQETEEASTGKLPETRAHFEARAEMSGRGHHHESKADTRVNLCIISLKDLGGQKKRERGYSWILHMTMD